MDQQGQSEDQLNQINMPVEEIPMQDYQTPDGTAPDPYQQAVYQPGQTEEPMEQSAIAGNSRRRLIILAVVSLAVILTGAVLGGLIFRSRQVRKGNVNPAPSSLPTATEAPVSSVLTPAAEPRFEIPVTSADPAVGSLSAPVTVVLFADYDCRYCAAFAGFRPDLIPTILPQLTPPASGWEPTLPRLMEEYVKTNKVRFVFKDLGSAGTAAREAAKAARCAGEANKYWDYFNMLYKNQPAPNAFSEKNFKVYAESLRINAVSFANCLSSGRYDNEIEINGNLANSLNLQTVPAVFVNGRRFDGAVDYSEIRSAVESGLAER